MGSQSPEDAKPGQEPYPGERRTRLSGAWTALVTGTLALVVILVFILQNLQRVDLSFLVFRGHLPLAVALLFAVILGAVIVPAFGGARIRQLRMLARRSTDWLACRRRLQWLAMPEAHGPWRTCVTRRPFGQVSARARLGRRRAFTPLKGSSQLIRRSNMCGAGICC